MVWACTQRVGKEVNGPHCNILAAQRGIRTRGVALSERPGYVVLVRLLVHHGNSGSGSAPHHANDAPHHANDAPHHANDACVDPRHAGVQAKQTDAASSRLSSVRPRGRDALAPRNL